MSNPKTTANKQDTKSNFGKWGWSTIFFCLVCYFISGGMGTDGLNIFVNAISGFRGWDGNLILSFSTYGGWIGIIASFFFSRLIVSRGAKIVIVPTLFIAGVAAFFYGQAPTALSFGIAVAISSIASTGYGNGINALQNTWFPRKKALALGWSTMGLPLCTMIFPAVCELLLHNFGVQGMFTALGIFILAFAVISIFWAKDTPEEVGVAPDNDAMSAEEIRASMQAMKEYKSPWTISRLMKEKRTWQIGVGLGLVWLVTVGIVSQLVPALLAVGYERASAIGMLSVMGFFGLFGSYAWGWIDQKVGTKRASMLYSTWYMAALVLLIIMLMTGNKAITYAAVFMVGISVGGIGNLIPSMIGSVFGRHDFAAANQIIGPVTRAIMVTAHFYNAQVLSITGNRVYSYLGMIVMCVASILILSRIKPLDEKH